MNCNFTIKIGAGIHTTYLRILSIHKTGLLQPPLVKSCRKKRSIIIFPCCIRSFVVYISIVLFLLCFLLILKAWTNYFHMSLFTTAKTGKFSITTIKFLVIPFALLILHFAFHLDNFLESLCQQNEILSVTTLL